MAHRADAECSAVFDFEIGRRAPLELRRISDECFAQFRPKNALGILTFGRQSQTTHLSMGACVSWEMIMIGALNPCWIKSGLYRVR